MLYAPCSMLVMMVMVMVTVTVMVMVVVMMTTPMPMMIVSGATPGPDGNSLYGIDLIVLDSVSCPGHVFHCTSTIHRCLRQGKAETCQIQNRAFQDKTFRELINKVNANPMLQFNH